MSKRVTLTINRSRYDIDLEEGFAKFLAAQLKEDFNLEGNNDIKVLLQAYVQKNYEHFEQEKKMNGLLKRLAKLEEE